MEGRTNDTLNQIPAETPERGTIESERKLIRNIPNKEYKFKLLEQLVNEMRFQMEPETVFKKQEFAVDKDYPGVSDEESAYMTPMQHVYRRLQSLFYRLEEMFVGSDLNLANMAIDVVFNGINRLHKRRLEIFANSQNK
ncbi:uncharacterized protein LOC117147080 [Drosophila mauritiana]|uniref:Uncharacterized protein LOC117147080 n=1 Tax=Drosophila mauritiana TaxID=7226 RepID=A0A6P8L151_DROMA|nr:uncharacterized protein LOC117147080 [Drosophila mauritiana]